MGKKITIILVMLYLVDSAIAGNVLIADVNDVKMVTSENTDFALTLYGKLKDDSNVVASKGNLFFSPYSISTALAIAYGGESRPNKGANGNGFAFYVA